MSECFDHDVAVLDLTANVPQALEVELPGTVAWLLDGHFHVREALCQSATTSATTSTRLTPTLCKMSRRACTSARNLNVLML